MLPDMDTCKSCLLRVQCCVRAAKAAQIEGKHHMGVMGE